VFSPDKLTADYKFDFPGNFEEVSLKTEDGITLNNLLFKADNSKGIILYLHGNETSLARYGKYAEFYTDLGYDIFMTDYRGYGKSEGSISSENQAHQDNQMLYDELKKTYSEDKIIIIGFSLGTSFAAKLASENSPKFLILQAPLYSGEEQAKQEAKEGNITFKIAEFFPLMTIMKYSLKTNEFIQKCEMPILIFHGDADKKIPYEASVKLKEHFKPEDRLILLEGEKHNTFPYNPIYQKELKKLLVN